MSKLKTNTIRHVDGSNDNITLDSSQNVTVEGVLKTDSLRHTGASSDAVTLASDGTCTAKITNNLSNRNLIINGDFQIAQRATTNDTTGATSTYHTLDRWFTQIQAGTITESQQTLTSSDTGPWEKGFRKYMRIKNNGTPIGAGAAQYAEIDQRIEAQTVAQSGWDYTSTSSYITVSFWLRASVAQSYVVVLYSQDGTQRHYPFEVALSANTWTKVTKTIPGNSGITVNNDIESGLALCFVAAYGTNYTSDSGSFNVWNTTGGGTNRWPDMATGWATTANATFDVTGVQLEVGDVATDFEHRSYGDELARCKRYYNRYQDGNNKYLGSTAFQYNSGVCISTFRFSTEMRDEPTVDASSGTNYFTIYVNGAASNFDSWDSINGMTLRGGCVNAAVTGTAGHAGGAYLNNSSAYIAFNAEL